MVFDFWFVFFSFSYQALLYILKHSYSSCFCLIFVGFHDYSAWQMSGRWLWTSFWDQPQWTSSETSSRSERGGSNLLKTCYYDLQVCKYEPTLELCYHSSRFMASWFPHTLSWKQVPLRLFWKLLLTQGSKSALRMSRTSGLHCGVRNFLFSLAWWVLGHKQAV